MSASATTGKGEGLGSLGGLLVLPPDDPRAATLFQWLEQQLRSGGKSYLYCLDEGVRALDYGEVQSSVRRGLRLFGCAQAVRQRGLRPGGDFTLGGLGLLDDLLVGVSQVRVMAPGSGIADEGPDVGSVGQRCATGRRVVVITVGNEALAGRGNRAAEAVRVAAGLAVGGRLEVVLGISRAGHRALFSAADQAGTGRRVREHWDLFRRSGGQLWAGSGEASGSDEPSLTAGLTMEEGVWEGELRRAFAVIPM